MNTIPILVRAVIEVVFSFFGQGSLNIFVHLVFIASVLRVLAVQTLPPLISSFLGKLGKLLSDIQITLMKLTF